MDVSWLWVPATLAAASAQTARNATQRRLTETLGTVGATQVRFLYGFPFAALFLLVVLAVSGEAVMEVIRQNVKMSQEVVRQMLGRVGEPHGRDCICAEALKYSLITERSMIPAETLKALEPIVGKYIKAE